MSLYIQIAYARNSYDKEIMNLKDTLWGYIGGFGGKKEKEVL